ncbi:MAG: hypothetical protein EOO65_03625 [Methanosarcinales archaeon]|nr:MAG: hypothetical protein EOO65_03625 [Methanosarcinales archaeon]
MAATHRNTYWSSDGDVWASTCTRGFEAIRHALHSPAHGGTLIPRRLHFIWLGGRLPPKLCRLVDSWRALHPRWEVTVWDDDAVASMHLRCREQYDAAPNYGARSDVLRYELLLRFGGAYADVDVQCLRPLDRLHQVCFASLLIRRGVYCVACRSSFSR